MDGEEKHRLFSSRRERVKVGCALMAQTLILGVALSLAVTPLYADEKLRVGFPSLATALSPSWITSKKGFWKRYGLDVELIYMAGGVTVPALIGGSVQLIIGSDPETTIAILKGANLVRLGVTTNSLGSSLLTQQSIQSIKELKGKTIGIGSRGRTSLEVRLSELLRDNGIDPKQDVKFLPIGGGPPSRVAALEKGIILAAMITPPYDLVAEKRGLKILSRVDVPLIAGGISTTLPFLKNNREVLIRFLKGYMEGIRYLITYRRENVEFFSSYLGNPDLTIMARFYDEIAGRVDKGLRPNVKSVRFLIDFVALDLPQAKYLTERDHWDLSLLEEIHLSGFLEQLYRK